MATVYLLQFNTYKTIVDDDIWTMIALVLLVRNSLRSLLVHTLWHSRSHGVLFACCGVFKKWRMPIYLLTSLNYFLQKLGIIVIDCNKIAALAAQRNNSVSLTAGCRLTGAFQCGSQSAVTTEDISTWWKCQRKNYRMLVFYNHQPSARVRTDWPW